MDVSALSNAHRTAVRTAVATVRAMDVSELFSQRTAVATPRAITAGGLSAPHKKLVQPHRRYTPATTMPPAIAPIANPPITISATARAESCAPPLSVSGGLGFTAGSATATGVPASVEDHGPSATPFTARTCTSYTVPLVSDRILYLKGGVPVPRVQASSTNSHSAPPLGRYRRS